MSSSASDSIAKGIVIPQSCYLLNNYSILSGCGLTQGIMLSCRDLYSGAFFFGSISGAATKLIFILRVYALFGQKRSLLILLCPFIIADIIGAFLMRFSTIVIASQGTYVESFSSCFWTGNFELQILSVVVLTSIILNASCQIIYILVEVVHPFLQLTFDSIIFVLTLFRMVHHHMRTRKSGIHSITEVILHDGIQTALALELVLSGGIVSNNAEGAALVVNNLTLNVLPNLLINRFVLNLRAFSNRTIQHSSKGPSDISIPTLNALSFAENRFLGNIGASLDFNQWDEVEEPETGVEREDGDIGWENLDRVVNPLTTLVPVIYNYEKGGTVSFVPMQTWS
ncbi:hypothetical protein BDP27DRAFT_1370200 [Rhodocollybia butyracea]|uniref:Uncharacterized protein n=1 Tax=Rhodocollybia butyracea TaxID=206335 RepID=A0A9P5PCF9_9AGAR|nr:hypothetical protein BDP27DRAFT_1370200 [Rhodocollybia butyracea]